MKDLDTVAEEIMGGIVPDMPERDFDTLIEGGLERIKQDAKEIPKEVWDLDSVQSFLKTTLALLNLYEGALRKARNIT